MLSKILIAIGTFLVLALAIFAVVVALQPSDYLLERSTTIDAPAEKVFAQVNDFKAWDKWTPWKAEDPNPKETKISIPSSGKGASFSWNGNDKIGEGKMTIIDSKPYERVDLEQEFKRPMVDKCRMSFVLEPEGEQTRLTWKMLGKNNFTKKAVCLFMDLEKMLGPKFELGLAAIKDAAEAANEPAPEPAVNP